MPELTCSGCGEATDLHGRPGEAGIRITCGACGHEWDRDARHRCATCGGGDIVTRPATLTAFSRGSQLSVLGWHDVPLCGACDHDELTRSTRCGGPLAADYRSAALYPRPAPASS